MIGRSLNADLRKMKGTSVILAHLLTHSGNVGYDRLAVLLLPDELDAVVTHALCLAPDRMTPDRQKA